MQNMHGLCCKSSVLILTVLNIFKLHIAEISKITDAKLV